MQLNTVQLFYHHFAIFFKCHFFNKYFFFSKTTSYHLRWYPGRVWVCALVGWTLVKGVYKFGPDQGGRRCRGVSCKMYTEIVTRISLVLTLSSSTNAEHYPSLCVRNTLMSFSSESIYIADMMLMFMTFFSIDK